MWFYGRMSRSESFIPLLLPRHERSINMRISWKVFYWLEQLRQMFLIIFHPGCGEGLWLVRVHKIPKVTETFSMWKKRTKKVNKTVFLLASYTFYGFFDLWCPFTTQGNVLRPLKLITIEYNSWPSEEVANASWWIFQFERFTKVICCC